MNYLNLPIQHVRNGAYELVPIRFEDRTLIRTWRNEQMYHLRQMEPLTEVQQELYFTEVVASLFREAHPTQYLFSYLKDGECIGYGGLVHIDYQRGSAELSFIMNTALERDEFDIHWSTYLHLIEKIAFEGLKFNRIFTYAYDLRPHLYPILAHAGFYLERILPNALIENDRSIPALIHSKWNAVFRRATNNDLMVTFKWAQEPLIRQFSFNQQEISKTEHESWFDGKITDSNCYYFMLETSHGKAIGSFRIDVLPEQSTGVISYLLDPEFHGKGWGIALLVLGQDAAKQSGIKTLIGEVMPENSSSSAIFVKLGYDAEVLSDRIRYQKSL